MVKTKRKSIVDMTEGNSLEMIIRFSLPLMLASMIQQLFSLTDAVILGVFGGERGLAVLGTCSWPCWFQVSTLTNLGQAACLLTAVRFGAKDNNAFKKAVGNVYIASVIIGIVMMPGLQTAVVPLLKIQDTPLEMFADATVYLRIIYVGTIFLLIYNTLSSLLRAVGDSVTSFLAIIIGAVINIVLDIILVTGFDMGAKGAAIATTASQAVSALICLIKIKQYPEFRLDQRHLKPEWEILKEYVGICIPMMAQSAVIATGGIYVQQQINHYGISFAAGVSAAGKIFGVVETTAIALAQACASFVSQNVGGKKFDRIQKAVKQVCIVSIGIAVLVSAGLLLFGKSILSFYVKGTAQEYAMGSLQIYCIGLLIMYPMYSLRQTVQAMGNLKIPLIAAILQLAVRVLTAKYLPLLMGSSGIFFTNLIAWLVSIILIGLVYPKQFRLCREKYEAR